MKAKLKNEIYFNIVFEDKKYEYISEIHIDTDMELNKGDNACFNHIGCGEVNLKYVFIDKINDIHISHQLERIYIFDYETFCSIVKKHGSTIQKNKKSLLFFLS